MKKIYKLKKLPVDRVSNKTYNGDGYINDPVMQRIADLEAIINLLGMEFVEGEGVTLNDNVKELFDFVQDTAL